MTAAAQSQTDFDALAQRAKARHDNMPRKVLAHYYPWHGNATVEGGRLPLMD